MSSSLSYFPFPISTIVEELLQRRGILEVKDDAPHLTQAVHEFPKWFQNESNLSSLIINCRHELGLTKEKDMQNLEEFLQFHIAAALKCYYEKETQFYNELYSDFVGKAAMIEKFVLEANNDSVRRISLKLHMLTWYQERVSEQISALTSRLLFNTQKDIIITNTPSLSGEEATTKE
jgi:hypothetical protein